MRLSLLAAALLLPSAAIAQRTESDFVAKNFKFVNGESLPELKIHYVTLGRPQKDASGIVRNAVLMLHGDRKSTRLNSSHSSISYAVFSLKKKTGIHGTSACPIPQYFRTWTTLRSTRSCDAP